MARYTVGLEKYSRPTLRDQDQDRKYQDQDLRSQDQDQVREKSVSSALETKTAVSRTTSLVKTKGWYVNGGDFTGALHGLGVPVVTTTDSIQIHDGLTF